MSQDGASPKPGSGKTVIVAGGGGFLGSRICDAFLERGWRVVSAGIGAPIGLRDGTHHHEGLVTRELLTAASDAHGSPDLIVHAAGGSSVGQSWESPRSDFDLSVGSTAEILDFARHQMPRPRLTLVSSAAVYGDVGSGSLSEDDLCLPMSPYGAHKRVCEELVLAESRMSGVGVAVVRFFSLFGNGLRKQILWDILRRSGQPSDGPLELWGDGRETRDFLHVHDAARLILLASTAIVPGRSRVYNGASGSPVSIRDLASALLRAAGVSKELHFNGKHRAGDPRHLTASTARAQNELGFEPAVSLDEGLSAYVAWFRSEQSGPAPGEVAR
jgi:UDP-glucose 4-epimerase